MNAGFQRPITIFAPEGTLVNAQEPAAVGGRTDTCQRVVDVLLGAFSSALPQEVIAASNGATTALIFGGTKKLSGKDFIYIEALGGGMGARFNRDGLDGLQVHITNTSNLPVEALEIEYPLRVLRYGLVENSGGPGKNRGGLGIEKEIMTLRPLLFSAHADRHRLPPWGLNGGQSGQPGVFLLKSGPKQKRKIPSKINGLLLQPGDILLARTAGGGGYGSPWERAPEKVLNDFIAGKISLDHARQAYGVVIKGKKINHKATTQLRLHRKKTGGEKR
jgi:N-methylhydantoinase B